jgi:hypothetical protein
MLMLKWAGRGDVGRHLPTCSVIGSDPPLASHAGVIQGASKEVSMQAQNKTSRYAAYRLIPLIVAIGVHGIASAYAEKNDPQAKPHKADEEPAAKPPKIMVRMSVVDLQVFVPGFVGRPETVHTPIFRIGKDQTVSAGLLELPHDPRDLARSDKFTVTTLGDGFPLDVDIRYEYRDSDGAEVIVKQRVEFVQPHAQQAIRTKDGRYVLLLRIEQP